MIQELPYGVDAVSDLDKEVSSVKIKQKVKKKRYKKEKNEERKVPEQKNNFFKV
jgi:hypothetical protein